MNVSGSTEVRLRDARKVEGEPVWTRGTILAILLAYSLGFLVMALAAGPWQAVRDFAVEGLILFLWLAAAWLLLRDQPVIESLVRRPLRELILGIIAVGLLAGGAALFYLSYTWFIFVNLAVIYLLLGVILGMQKDRRLAFGLRWPPRRAWLVLLAVVVINILPGAILGGVLPEGELPTPPGADLAEEITSVGLAFLILGQLAITAAIPEELFFRVYLQPRLSRFMPVGWAILTQATLFSAAHLPQALIRNGETWPVALAGVFTIANGVMGGYLWHRTRSLPLLVLLHLFAYPRIGL